MIKYIKHVLFGLLLLIPGFVYSAQPLFSISPLKKGPIIVYSGQTATVVIYKVTNNTPFLLKGNSVATLPSGIKQANGGCSNKRFNLAARGSCLLYLTINADKLKSNLKGGPVVCSSVANPVYCSRPTVDNELNIVKRPKPLVKKALLRVNPSSFNLLKDGASQVVTITNKGPVNASGIGVKLASTALGIRVTSNCPASLSYLAPKNTCQLKFTSGATIGSTTALISGTNSNVVTERITVNTQVATISSPTLSFNLTPGDPGNVGTIKITNKSSIIAKTIRADLSEVGGALSAIYSNCDAVAFGAQCTITFTANQILAPTNILIKGSNTTPLSVSITVAVMPTAIAVLEVDPAQINLIRGGALQKVTLKNSSDVDAENLMVTIPNSEITYDNSSSCTSLLAANSECEYYFKAGTQNEANTVISIEGSNTSAPVIINATVSDAFIKLTPEPFPDPFVFIAGQTSSLVTVNNESDLEVVNLQFAINSNNLQIDPSSTCNYGINIPAHDNCTLVFNSQIPTSNVLISIFGENTNEIQMHVSALTSPLISISPFPSARYINLDDINQKLIIGIDNAPNAQETSISVDLPFDWWDIKPDTTQCQNLQPGGHCEIIFSADHPNAIHVPGMIQITGSNNANSLSTKVATFKGGGLVFYKEGQKAKVAYPVNILPLLWQQGIENGINTDVNDGETNTHSIIQKIGAGTNYAAGYCNSLPVNFNDGGSTWYLPAICELGGNQNGGPQGCNFVYNQNNMMNLMGINDINLSSEYWSSTESTPGDKAWIQNFFSSNQRNVNEFEFHDFRCVRSFGN